MSTQTFYPSLSTLIPVENIPNEAGIVRTGLQNIFSHLYFSDLHTDRTASGDAAFYSLKLRTYKRIALEIPGTNGLALVLNPDLDPNSSTPVSSSLPLSVSYRWPVLKFFRDFNLPSFSYSGQEFFNLLLNITGASKEELLYEVIFLLIDDPDLYPVQKFVDDFNAAHSPATPLVKGTANDPEVLINDLVVQLNTNGNNFDVFTIIFQDYCLLTDVDDMFNRLAIIFSRWLAQFSINDIKDFLIPHVSASFYFNFGLEFPLSILRMVDANGTPVLVTTGPNAGQETPALLVCNGGYFTYDSKNGFGFDYNYSLSFLNYAEIKGTGLYFTIQNAKIDLSKTKNIVEADADGRSNDFIGVFIQDTEIHFPKFLNHDTAHSTAVIKGKNLLIGSGGLSGSVSLESGQQNGAALFRLGDTSNTGKHFQIGLTQFAMEFKQNAIVSSDISGYMKVPGFKDVNGNDAQIDISAHIGNKGDFRITASENDGVIFRIPNALDVVIKSLTIGRENDLWYVEASGSILITANIPGAAADFLKQPIDVKKVRIWQDGSIEFLGGGITLPTQMHLRIGPVSLALSHMSFGAHEGVYQGVKRQYFYFGFNGELKTGPGGVDVRGDGVEFHFTRDSGAFHSYLRIAGIGVDIRIPGNASPEAADILINGYLAMRNGPDANGNIQTAGPEYQGAVGFKIKPLKIAGKGSMAMRPKVPAFIVDVELELSTPLSLGATGLGIYGFRGLIGSHYVASRQYVGLSEQDSWYEYLKKKVPPRNQVGIGIEKFDPDKKGFALGVGATIGTMGDNGWTFSSKVFVLLSMPEMLLIEGQANVLHKRLGIDSESDPPFYAFLVVDSNSVQAGIGVNYKIPDNSGAIMSMRGEMQMAYFFNNSSAWYVNIGKDLPEEKRLQSRLFNLFNAYAYLMINPKGIKAGAGAKFDLQKKFGPVRVGLYAYIDARGFISFKPIQLGGAIQLGGGVYLKVGRFGIELQVAAGLSAEAPKPFVIEGFLQLKLKLGFFKVRIKLEFTWIFNRELNTDEVKLLDPADFASLPAGETVQFPFKAINMLSEEAFVLKYIGDNLAAVNPETDSSWNNYIIPMDSFIDVEFKKGVKPYNNRYGGGINPLPQFTEYLAPQKGRMPQVKHDYSVENIEIKIWNKTTRQWEDYNPWEALALAFQNAGLTVNTANYDYGYWQYNNVPGKYTSLRLLSQSPFAVSNGTPPENNGILAQHILCQGVVKTPRCQYWNEIDARKIYPAAELIRDRNVLLRFNNTKGRIGGIVNAFGVDRSLKTDPRGNIEIFFKEPMAAVELSVTCMFNVTVKYYSKNYTGENTLSGLPRYAYELIRGSMYDYRQQTEQIRYADASNPVSKIVIEADYRNRETAYEYFHMYTFPLLRSWTKGNPSLPQWQQDQIAAWLALYNSTTSSLFVSKMGLADLLRDWQELYDSRQLPQQEQDILFNWIQRYSGSMGDAARAMQEIQNELDNVLNNAGSYSLLYSYAFTWKQIYFGYIPIGKTDYAGLYLHEVCVQSIPDYEYNVLLGQRSQSAITDNMKYLAQAINETLPPVWRPDSSYAIMITTKDDVQTDGSGGMNYTRKFGVGFKTGSVLGFFHKTQPAYLALEQQNKADQYKLANLRHYVDYQRSYPNADGKLIAAKPLYYKNPKLGLFFSKPYVYEFFTKWDAYKGNAAKEYQLLSLILDPVDKPGAPPVLPPEVVGWQLRKGQQSIPVNAADIETVSNILTQGNPNCTGITTIVKPPTMNALVQKSAIKPQKLYSAIFKAIDVNTAGNQESIVHSYVFETSRYGDFTEHIESYKRKMIAPDTGQEVVSNAFFALPLTGTTTEWQAINTKLQQVLANTLPVSDPLQLNYASVYDRIITGVLQLKAQQAGTGTEFNIIKAVNTSTNTTTVLGILVKSPEPFNDPKLPAAEMATTLGITDPQTGGTQFNCVFAKDNASVFITNPALSLPLRTLNITFTYKRFDGVVYTVDQIVTVPVPVNL